jgi:hypothetical protein
MNEVTKSENQLQAEIFQHHWNNYPHERGLLFHVNNKARNAIEGNRFKAMGVVPGVSDLIYLRKCGKPLFIELKLPGCTQSDIQIEWQAKVEAAGYEYRIATSLEEFLFCISQKTP